MAESPVIYALRDKRARLAGYIQDLENRLKNSYANLEHLDATIRLFDPQADPSKIVAKRTYFVRNERKGIVYRGLIDVLRIEVEPLLISELAERLMMHLGRDVTNAVARKNMSERIAPMLRRLKRKGWIDKVGAGPKTRWEIAR